MVAAATRGAFCAATATALLLLQVVGAAEFSMQAYRRRGIKIPRITTTSTTSTAAPEHPPMQIPLDMARRLNEIENVTDFIDHFIDKNSVSEDDFVSSRFGDTDERKAIQYAKQAVCKPELQTVQIYPNNNPLEVPYPSCTRIERCGGCCGHSLLSCQPSDTEIVNFQVYIAEYKGGDLLQHQRKEVVPVERHLKCKCSCIIKEKDCNKLQKYLPNECACACQNTDEEEKCTNQQNIKLWDPLECSCKCRNIRECSTGFFFDSDTCSCQPSNRWQTPGVQFPSASFVW